MVIKPPEDLSLGMLDQELDSITTWVAKMHPTIKPCELWTFVSDASGWMTTRFFVGTLAGLETLHKQFLEQFAKDKKPV